jgi:hypothetical protein
MGDFELGRLAAELICDLCLEEEGSLILLQRWPADEETSAYALLRPGLAA